MGMSEILNHAVTELNRRLSGKGYQGTAMFVLTGEGSIFVDSGEARVGEGPAEVTLTASPDTFLGSAYVAARGQNRLMDWDEIIAAYDRFRGEDHSAIRALIRY